jgi:hydrogenase maturation protease
MDPVSKRIIVVGVGDRFASDDAAGLELAAELRRTPGHVCEVRDIENCPPSFLTDLPPDSTVIFADAVRTGARPGTIHAVRLPSEKVCPRTKSSAPAGALAIHHQIHLLQHLASPSLPMYLLGIEVENRDPGIGITTSIHAAILEVVRELAKFNGRGQPKLPFFTDNLRSD